ncbi:MAG TPA: hypothetical protein VL295_05820 [Gemmatimonadales bacterium]|nr:hypothetical protein [Gemmatimonadales bacterium]
MQARPLLTALALVAGATAFAAPTGPATTQRLKITSTNHQVIDLSAFGQGEQVTHIVTSTFVTITAADSAGGRTVKLVVDSARADSVASQAPVDPATFDSLRGTTATGWVGPNGVIQNVAGAGARGAQVSGLLRALFPRMAPRAKTGDRWSDTTETPGEMEGLPPGTTSKRITNWSVTGEETVSGLKARKVESAYSQAVSGEVQSQNGAIGLDGTGTGSATYLIAPDGRQVGFQSNMTLSLTLAIAQAPEPLPLSLTSAVVATPIR